MLLKHRHVTKEQENWIFSLENEIAKKKAKKEQKRIKEFNMKNIDDLRKGKMKKARYQRNHTKTILAL